MTYAKITGTGSYLPEKVLTNAELATMVDTSDEWIMKRVGIRERRLVADSGDTTSSMAVQAAKRALESAGLAANDIDLIVVGTTTPDKLFPSTASLVQRELGITNECGAMDINAACAGFIYSLSVANQYVRSGDAKTVLVIGVDTLSTVVDWQDRTTSVLFGDGAGAVILQASDEPGVVATELKAAGKYADLLCADNGLWTGQGMGKVQMDGHEVFKCAVRKLDEIVEHVLLKAGVDKSAIDWLIPHQANLRIIQATAKRLALPMEQVVMTIERHGNTSAASVPLALDHAIRNGQVQRGQTLLLEAFGAGFTWGAALVQY